MTLKKAKKSEKAEKAEKKNPVKKSRKLPTCSEIAKQLVKCRGDKTDRSAAFEKKCKAAGKKLGNCRKKKDVE